MLKLRVLFPLLCILSVLQADPPDQAATEGDPSSTICDSVNLLTGNLVASSEDLVIDGAQPLHIHRQYVSGNGKSKDKNGGWVFLPHTKLEIVPKNEETEKIGDTFRRVIVTEPNGTQMIFRREKKLDVKEAWVPYTYDFKTYGQGITNTSRGQISGRTNLKNHRLYQQAENLIVLYCADGTKRHYHRYGDIRYPTFLLKVEYLPNGNEIHYKYDNNEQLIEMYSSSPKKKKTYAWCKFKYKDHDIEITTSDDRVLKYKFLSKKIDKRSHFFLRKVIGPELPKETQKYIKGDDKTGPLLKSRSLPNERKIRAEYYLLGTDYTVENRSVSIHRISDKRAFRVKTLLQTVGKNQEPVPTHHFLYNINDKNETQTDVYDSKHNKTTACFSNAKRPTEVRYHEKDKLHHQIHMQWGDYGQLSEKAVTDAEGIHLLNRKYSYDKQGNIEHETLSGNFCSLRSSDTQTVEYKYTKNNLLKEKLDPTGLITQITYIPNTDLIARKIITDGNQIHLREFYTYSEDNILILKITDDGISDNPEDLSGITTRKHERIRPKKESPAQNLPEYIEEYAFDLETNQEILLQKTHLHYNKHAKVTRKDLFGANGKYQYSLNVTYDDRGNILTKTDALKRTTAYTYDIHSNILAQVDPDGKKTLRTYDCANRLISETEYSPENHSRVTTHKYNTKNQKIATTDPFGNTTTYKYDAFDHITAIQHPDGSTETFTYDLLGNQNSYTNANGHTTTTIHNVLGKPLKIHHPDKTEEDFEYYPDGQLKSYTNQEGLTQYHTYDALGREISLLYIDQYGAQIAEETFTYDSLHLLSHIDKEGILTTYTYDSAGRKQSTKRGQLHIQYEYDTLSRLHKEIQDSTLTTIHTYNFDDQLIEKRHEDQNGNLLYKIAYSYDVNGNQKEIIQDDAIESFTYDSFNRLISHETAEGERTIIGYDENHLNAENQRTLRKITTDPLQYRTIETHDILLRLIHKEIRSPWGNTLFAEAYTYDPCGNCILKQCHVYEQDTYFRTLEVTKEYDSMHRVITIQEGAYTSEEKTSHFIYTPTGKLKTTQKPDNTLLTYTYDLLGNNTRLTSSDRTIDYSYIYTLNGDLLQSTDHIHNTSTTRILDDNSNVLEETLANTLTLRNRYDNLNRRTQLTLPQDTQITYTYNPLYLTHVTAFDFTASYTYDTVGNTRTVNLIDTITYTYDKMHRKTQLQSPSHNQSIFYDARGNIQEMETDDSLYNFTYDGLNQLIKENTHDYRYDSYHNRTRKDTLPYASNTIHALIQAGSTSYTHDPNGNPLTKTTPTAQTHYKYDALDRLIEITQENSWRLTFSYDSFHRRTTRTLYRYKNEEWSKQAHHNFLYDGQDEIGAFDENGHLLELRVLGHRNLAEREALLIKLNNTLYRPILDLQGNVIRVISLDNSQVLSYRYNAFGEEFTHADENPWHYSSKRLDPESDLIYFGRRYYDPETGRFLTPDPSPFTDSSNLYAYVLNNPLANLDLYGLFATEYPTQPPSSKASAPSSSPIVTTDYHYEDRQFAYQEEIIEQFKQTHNINFTIPIPLERSSIYDLQKTEVNDQQRIMYVNGILNKSDVAKASAEYISQLSGGFNIHGIHAATFGLFTDIERANMGLIHHIATEPVNLLQESWYDYFKNAGPNATILIFAHSRGAIDLSLALMLFDKELRKRIFVVAIAPAKFIDPDTCGGVRHYCSTRDIVYRADPEGRRKFASTIHMLTRHPDAPRFDHSIQSPTYKESMKTNIELYITEGRL